MNKVLVKCLILATVSSIRSDEGQAGDRNIKFSRVVRQDVDSKSQVNGFDFSGAALSEDGKLCIIKEDTIDTLSRDPVLKCEHKTVEKCHLTYVTYFNPSQEEQCEEIFSKKCQITFRKEASRETVRKCYSPLVKVCNGQGPQECRTVREASCTTRYVEDNPGHFIADTKCEAIPKEICGQGCVTEEAPEECHEKNIDSLVDVPEEVCDLNPQKSCRHVTKLVPSLRPTEECTKVPTEVCSLTFGQSKIIKQPLRTEWCMDPIDSSMAHNTPKSSFEPSAMEIPQNTELPSTELLPTNNPAEPASSSYEAVRKADLLNTLEKLRVFGNILTL